MKVLFKYRDESPLLPSYSRYEEVHDKGTPRHVGMIHLHHKDWEGEWSHGGKTHHMPAEIEIMITAMIEGHIVTENEPGSKKKPPAKKTKK